MGRDWEKHFRSFDDLNASMHAYRAAVLRDAVEACPDGGAFWLLLGDELTQLRRYAEAEAALERGLELAPREHRRKALTRLGVLEEERGNFEGAERRHWEAIEDSPDHATGYMYLGRLLAARGKLNEAEPMLRRAVACAEGCIDEAYLNLGLLFRAQGRLKESKAALEQAIELDKDYEVARRALEDVERAAAYVSDTDD